MKTQLTGSAEFGVANRDHFVGNIYGEKRDAKKYGHTQRKKKVLDDIVIDGVELPESWIGLLAVEQDGLNAPNRCTKQSGLGMSGPRVSPLARTDDYDSAKSDKSVFSKFGRGTTKLLKSISKKGRMDVGATCDSIYSPHVEYSHNTGESTVNISLNGMLMIGTIFYAGKFIWKRPSTKREAPGYCGCDPAL
jgi:hypothetical protein